MNDCEPEVRVPYVQYDVYINTKAGCRLAEYAPTSAEVPQRQLLLKAEAEPEEVYDPNDRANWPTNVLYPYVKNDPTDDECAREHRRLAEKSNRNGK